MHNLQQTILMPDGPNLQFTNATHRACERVYFENTHGGQRSLPLALCFVLVFCFCFAFCFFFVFMCVWFLFCVYFEQILCFVLFSCLFLRHAFLNFKMKCKWPLSFYHWPLSGWGVDTFFCCNGDCLVSWGEEPLPNDTTHRQPPWLPLWSFSKDSSLSRHI